MDYKTYTTKQAGVVYRAFKEGKIEMTKGDASKLYDFAGSVEVLNTNSAKVVETIAYAIRNAVDAIFAGDYATAQTSIDNFIVA